jgi:hypothetical protein
MSTFPYSADLPSLLARERQDDLIREAAERRLARAHRLPPRSRRRFLRWP